MGSPSSATLLTVLLLLFGLLSHCCGDPVRPYQMSLSDDERQVCLFDNTVLLNVICTVIYSLIWPGSDGSKVVGLSGF